MGFDDSTRIKRGDVKRWTKCDEGLEKILKLLSPDLTDCDEVLESLIKTLSSDLKTENVEKHQASNRLPCLHSDVLPSGRRETTRGSVTLRVGRRPRLRWRARETLRPSATQKA